MAFDYTNTMRDQATLLENAPVQICKSLLESIETPVFLKNPEYSTKQMIDYLEQYTREHIVDGITEIFPEAQAQKVADLVSNYPRHANGHIVLPEYAERVGCSVDNTRFVEAGETSWYDSTEAKSKIAAVINGLIKLVQQMLEINGDCIQSVRLWVKQREVRWTLEGMRNPVVFYKSMDY